jgi:2-polyprenyl-3-methyl-5-hydroxy-6-metoxy-1,4-benzoquinol methylase
MKRSEFRAYQETTIKRFEHILNSHEKGQCDEQGLPSYTNPNPLMRWLTWKRVEVVLSAIASLVPLKNALDFGCGYGVFLPYLIANAENTIAFDIMIDELKVLGEEAGWQRITYESDLTKIASSKQYFDLILAIEVLEHIDELDKTIKMFYEILNENGSLLVAGPTENYLYRIGRKLAGYSGDYHVRNIYDIHAVLEKQFHLQKIATIVPGLPFYNVYRCIKSPI